ncbi:LysR family transcriptional regulator [uncultured Ferrovibrio sp.]|jgi:DNA-binding transcriptional LysR family regulator|uniref:LysR family transcriptional regulator n=1 Tax=uncultured Ferrovibrio sp. TaxID=1576913 RepID=UPI00263137D5|nr:LysR family transcriptional regulator [uncultured Ferrovibrio sp.]
MELSDLHVFRTVVEAGGITHAAKRLHRVQSNVTARIRKLEEDLQVQLFVRESRRLQLTPAGRTLLGYADQLLGLAARAREALHDTTPRGLLRIGTMESTAGVRLPAPLAEYHRRYPEVQIELEIGSPRTLIPRLLDGTMDVALLAEPFEGGIAALDARFDHRVVFVENLVLVSAANHPPIRRPQDVKVGTVLAFHPGCSHRERLLAWFTRGGANPGRVVELSSYHTMLGCIAAGMGVGLMPASVLQNFSGSDRLRTHKLPPPFHKAQTVMLWRKEMPTPKVLALAEILEKGRASA